MQIHEWRNSFGNEKVFSQLGKLPHGLMLDVGAAVGMTTTELLAQATRGAVIAFEPFSGNWPHFVRVHGGDERVALVRKAVSDSNDGARVKVGAILNTTKAPWADYPGAATVYRIVPEGGEPVSTCTIDEVLDGDRAAFLSINLRDGEVAAIRGAEQALSTQKIDAVLVRYASRPDILALMHGHGYVCFDQPYFLVPREDADLSAWDVFHESRDSAKRRILKAYPRTRPLDADAWQDFMTEQRERVGVIWTDLVFLTPESAEALGASTDSPPPSKASASPRPKPAARTRSRTKKSRRAN